MIELLLCAALALYLATRAELRALAAQLGTGHRIFLATLLSLIVLGHLADEGNRTFPFPAWDMYAQRAAGDPVFHEFRLVRASGRREELTGFGKTPNLSSKLHQRLESLAHVGNNGKDASAAPAAGATLEAVLRGIAAARAGDVPDDPPVAIELWRATVTLHEPSDPSGVRTELVRRIELP